MHELYEMHDARVMQQVTSIKSNIQVTSIKSSIQHRSFQPYSPTHVFNGEFLFLMFLAWALISTGDIKNRRACQSLKVVKHRNNISKYKSLAQSLLAQNGVAQIGF